MPAPPSEIVFISVFSVDQEHQQHLIELFTAATEGPVDKAPGFLGAPLHRSIDGMKVTTYARWASLEQYLAMRQDPSPLPFLDEALSFAPFEPGACEILRRFEQAAYGRAAADTAKLSPSIRKREIFPPETARMIAKGDSMRRPVATTRLASSPMIAVRASLARISRTSNRSRASRLSVPPMKRLTAA